MKFCHESRAITLVQMCETCQYQCIYKISEILSICSRDIERKQIVADGRSYSWIHFLGYLHS